MIEGLILLAFAVICFLWFITTRPKYFWVGDKHENPEYWNPSGEKDEEAKTQHSSKNLVPKE